jgi:hypothetical protein
MKPLPAKAQEAAQGLPAVGKGVGIPSQEGCSSKKFRASVRKDHHLEHCSEKSDVLRTAMLVSANKEAGFVKETVKV